MPKRLTPSSIVLSCPSLTRATKSTGLSSASRWFSLFLGSQPNFLKEKNKDNAMWPKWGKQRISHSKQIAVLETACDCITRRVTKHAKQKQDHFQGNDHWSYSEAGKVRHGLTYTAGGRRSLIRSCLMSPTNPGVASTDILATLKLTCEVKGNCIETYIQIVLKIKFMESNSYTRFTYSIYVWKNTVISFLTIGIK